MRSKYVSPTDEKMVTEAILSAFEKQEDNIISNMADNMVRHIKSATSKGKSYPFSKANALELIGKVGIWMARNNYTGEKDG